MKKGEESAEVLYSRTNEKEESINIKCSPIESNVELPSRTHQSDKEYSFPENQDSASTARINHNLEYQQAANVKHHNRNQSAKSGDSTTNIIVTNRFQFNKEVINEEIYENIKSDSDLQ